MGSITQKIYELLTDGADIEQCRSTGIIIRSKVNFIDADYEGLDGRRTTEENSGVGSEVENTITGKQTPKSEINEQ